MARSPLPVATPEGCTFRYRMGGWTFKIGIDLLQPLCIKVTCKFSLKTDPSPGTFCLINL